MKCTKHCLVQKRRNVWYHIQLQLYMWKLHETKHENLAFFLPSASHVLKVAEKDLSYVG